MNVFKPDFDGRYVLTEECPMSWMEARPEANECPFCEAQLFLRVGMDLKGCCKCGAQLKIKLGDLL